MRVSDFSIFVNGPFVTNVYLDTGELQKMKRELREFSIKNFQESFQDEMKSKIGNSYKVNIGKDEFYKSGSSVFDLEERMLVLARVDLDPPNVFKPPIKEIDDINVEEIHIYFFTSGVGVISIKVSVKLKSAID